MKKKLIRVNSTSLLTGDVSGISGDVTGIRGNVTGIRGNMNGISGNIDNCELADADRKMGVSINDLVCGGEI